MLAVIEGVNVIKSVVLAIFGSLLLVGCSSGSSPLGPRASAGDVTMCVYVRGLGSSEVLSLRLRGEGGIMDDITDGQLMGLVNLAVDKPGGAVRNNVISRCRELGAFN